MSCAQCVHKQRVQIKPSQTACTQYRSRHRARATGGVEAAHLGLMRGRPKRGRQDVWPRLVLQPSCTSCVASDCTPAFMHILCGLGLYSSPHAYPVCPWLGIHVVRRLSCLPCVACPFAVHASVLTLTRLCIYAHHTQACILAYSHIQVHVPAHHLGLSREAVHMLPKDSSDGGPPHARTSTAQPAGQLVSVHAGILHTHSPCRYPAYTVHAGILHTQSMPVS